MMIELFLRLFGLDDPLTEVYKQEFSWPEIFIKLNFNLWLRWAYIMVTISINTQIIIPAKFITIHLIVKGDIEG